MKNNRFWALLAVAALGVTTAVAQRNETMLNFGWRFQAGNVENGAETGLNDKEWREVSVPHDFQIEQPWVAPEAGEKADNDDPAANIKSRLSSRGFKEMGMGWYRLHLMPADSLKGRRLLLDFGGIMFLSGVREHLLGLSDELAQDAEAAGERFEAELRELTACWKSEIAEKDRQLEEAADQLRRQKEYAARLEDEKAALREEFELEREDLQNRIDSPFRGGVGEGGKTVVF